MIHREQKTIPIDELLKDIDGLNGNQDVIALLKRFMQNNLIGTNGIIIVFTRGKDVDIDGTKFSEPEAIWALEKAKHKMLDKRLSFD